MGFECSGCVSDFFGFDLSNLKVAVMGQRSGKFPFYTPRDPKLHPTQEVYCAVLLSSAPHKLTFAIGNNLFFFFFSSFFCGVLVWKEDLLVLQHDTGLNSTFLSEQANTYAILMNAWELTFVHH